LAEAKPSTTLFARALAELSRVHGIKPHQVLYIGNDIRNDIDPAVRLGMNAALFAGDRRSLRTRREDPRLRSVRPAAVITSLPQITTALLRG
jgi:putative hydrolase of the HAD superfamily